MATFAPTRAGALDDRGGRSGRAPGAGSRTRPPAPPPAAYRSMRRRDSDLRHRAPGPGSLTLVVVPSGSAAAMFIRRVPGTSTPRGAHTRRIEAVPASGDPRDRRRATPRRSPVPLPGQRPRHVDAFASGVDPAARRAVLRRARGWAHRSCGRCSGFGGEGDDLPRGPRPFRCVRLLTGLVVEVVSVMRRSTSRVWREPVEVLLTGLGGSVTTTTRRAAAMAARFAPASTWSGVVIPRATVKPFCPGGRRCRCRRRRGR